MPSLVVGIEMSELIGIQIWFHFLPSHLVFSLFVNALPLLLSRWSHHLSVVTHVSLIPVLTAAVPLSIHPSEGLALWARDGFNQRHLARNQWEKKGK